MNEEIKKCHCGNPSRSKTQRYCLNCHSKKMKEWRKTHNLSKKSRKNMNARSYLHVYIKRGKIKKEPCEICGNEKVEGHHDDYDKPLEVRWLCRKHHLEIHNPLSLVV